MSGFLLEQVATPTPDVVALLDRHFALMRSQSPEESCHVMTADALFASDAVVCTLRDTTGAVLGMAALKKLDRSHGEVKSMHTKSEARGMGVGSALVSGLIAKARDLGMTRLSLETGSDDAFAAARRLYERHGFTHCAPFGTYVADPLSVFMTRTL